MKLQGRQSAFIRPVAGFMILTSFLLTVCPAAEPGKTTREVFPVPSVIAGIFKSGGLPAFDPFTLWERGSAQPPATLIPATPGGDAGLLPAGLVYDVLPVWKARGFQPQAGTRVLYHPGSRLLFAAIATGDEAEVRAYCQWPAGVWLGDEHWRGSRTHQLQAQITVWAVPAVGPGGWQFRPERPEDLMALPAEARRVVGRQTFAVRGGDKSKAETITRPRQTSDKTGPGMVTEMECTFADDGETVDFNFALTYLTEKGTGHLSEALIAFPQLTKVGEAWLVEGGCLPGNPPERLFVIFNSHPVEQSALTWIDLEKAVANWTGNPEAAPVSTDGMAGRLFDSDELEFLARRRREASLHQPAAPAPDPFEPRQSAPDRTEFDPLPGLDGEGWPVVTVPGLFGEANVLEITPVVEAFFGLAPGDVQAWVPPTGLFSSRYVFVRGKPAALYSMERQMAWCDHDPYRYLPITLMADVTIALALPGSPPDHEEVLWRARLPVRSDQISGLKNQAWSEVKEGAKPAAGAWDLKIEAERIAGPSSTNPKDPGKPDSWNLKVGGSLRPPLVDTDLDFPALMEPGTSEGASLLRKVGKMKDGREVILSVRLTPDMDWRKSSMNRLRLGGKSLSAGNIEWWWQQQVANAGVR